MADQRSAMTDIEFYRAEAEYWKNRAQEAIKFLTEISYRTNSLSSCDVPPEPPVGTRFFDTNGDSPGMEAGDLIWDRRDDGWYCCRQGCPNCPALWVDVYEYALPRSAARVLPGEVPLDGGA